MKKRETPVMKRARIMHGRAVLRKLKKLLPEAGMILRFTNNWELLVAVMLSAQCTDKKVNEVTPALFTRYRTLDEYANADVREVEKLIFQTGFYHTKAKRIIDAARYVKQNFDGKIPMTMEEILRIPGVARKTANVVLGNAHGVVEGIAVDTHVKRLARAFGLSDETDPVKIERDLMEVFPKKEWFHATYLMIEYGRKYCPSRPHDTMKCPLGHK